jgi:hypothetical protein
MLTGRQEVEEAKPIVPPPIVGPTEFSKAVMASLKGYEATWLDRDESDNFAQKHDEELARGVVRPTVEEEIRKQVCGTLWRAVSYRWNLLKSGGGLLRGAVLSPHLPSPSGCMCCLFASSLVHWWFCVCNVSGWFPGGPDVGGPAGQLQEAVGSGGQGQEGQGQEEGVCWRGLECSAVGVKSCRRACT